MNKYLLLEALDITRKAAIACFPWIGKGNEKSADKAAVDSMRNTLNKINIDGTVVIGEGERDKAPMLFIGEKVGIGGEKIDIALDPLEGTTICARGDSGALSVLAFAKDGMLLNAPDVYMDKIAIGSRYRKGVIDLDNTPTINIKNLAQEKGVKTEELCIMILDRERHNNIIKEIRATGASIKLIGDGDISAVLATSMENSGIDMYIGKGGAPEGVLAATALKSIGGQFQGRLCFKNNEEIDRAKKIGITDLNKKYNLNDLVKGDAIFVATGVTDGFLVKGVRKKNNGKITTESIVTNSAEKSLYKIFQA